MMKIKKRLLVDANQKLAVSGDENVNPACFVWFACSLPESFFDHDIEQNDHACPFFFSSSRRHTRCYRDWSSDVCSSDLINSIAAYEGKTAPAIEDELGE